MFAAVELAGRPDRENNDAVLIRRQKIQCGWRPVAVHRGIGKYLALVDSAWRWAEQVSFEIKLVAGPCCCLWIGIVLARREAKEAAAIQ
jgi:hypothetical protein